MTDSSPSDGRAAAVFVPSSPMLLPEYVGLDDPIADIRRDVVRAIADSLAGVDSVVILADHRAPAVGGWTGEPLGVRVGRHLLDLAGWEGPVHADTSHYWTAGTLYVVVGDGSARRSEKAPGHLDERSLALDAIIVAALESADTATLLGLDPSLCDELMVAGAPALRQAAHGLCDRPDLTGELLWEGDPWGVQYWIARWTTPCPAAG
ncbi:MAG: hypothetical protein ABI131_11050 [Nostocoides sp.]